MRDFAYLAYGATFLVPWIAVWIARRDLRTELLVTSLVTAPLGPLFESWYHVDYWRPSVLGPWPVGIEDLLFGFGVGGVGAVAYEVLTGRGRVQAYPWRNPLFFAAVFALGLAAHALLVPRVNSIYVSMAIFMVAAAVMVALRRDLAIVSVISGFVVACVMIVNYQVVLALHPTLFQDFWLLDHLSGRFILRVPIEEPLWGFCWGLFIGSAWKFGFGEICVPKSEVASVHGEVEPIGS